MSLKLIKLVKLLSDGRHHDGDSLGEQLQVTRSAVWKMIKKLTVYGVAFDTVKGKGYALLTPLVLLEARWIKKQLNLDQVEVQVFETLSSTNDYLKACQARLPIQICLAEQQTHGKGRLGRDWYSPFGQNLYLSCRYAFQKEISELSGLSLVTSLAVVAALRERGVSQLAVKWPNDIVHARGKLSGSLIDIQAETHGACHAVIGIGVNVNMRQANDAIDQAWTSMRQLMGVDVDRNELCVSLINTLIRYLKRFEAHGLADFVKEWSAHDCLMRQSVAIHQANGRVRGVVTGINAQGHLLLQLADGTVQAFSSGDTTLCKSA